MKQSSGLLYALLLVVSLSGCSFIHTYVKDWPELTTTISVIPAEDIYPTCSVYMSWFEKYILIGLPLACASINLDQKTCVVSVTESSPGWVLEHELAHCKGGDHGGVLQRGFDEWKQGR